MRVRGRSEITPWRAYQAYLGRAAVGVGVGRAAVDFTKSKLLGKKRRQHGALFPLYLMASDCPVVPPQAVPMTSASARSTACARTC